MASPNLLLILLLSCLCICISGNWAAERSQRNPDDYGRNRLDLGRKLYDSATPVTNPANFPPFTPTPTIITVPASNPSSLAPITTVPTSPTTNPATVGGTGGTWCIAKTGVPESSLQSALDYACGIGGADCSTIQQGGSCYNPNSIENHASYAFNSYFQKNPAPSSCDFGGAALLVNNNPSTGTCIYPSSAATTAMPSSMNPPATATPTDVPSSTFPPLTTSSPGATGGTPYGIPGSGYESPPSVLGASNPDSGSPYGLNSPPNINSMPAGSVVAASPRGSRPLISFIILIASFSTGQLILGT